MLCRSSGTAIARVLTTMRLAAAAGLEDPCVTPWPLQHKMRWSSRQTSLLRFNCADSLDRTNAASYFAAVQVPESHACAAAFSRMTPIRKHAIH